MNIMYIVCAGARRIRTLESSFPLAVGSTLTLGLERFTVTNVEHQLQDGGWFNYLYVEPRDTGPQALIDQLADALIEAEQVRKLGMDKDVHFESLRDARRGSVKNTEAALAAYHLHRSSENAAG